MKKNKQEALRWLETREKLRGRGFAVTPEWLRERPGFFSSVFLLTKK